MRGLFLLLHENRSEGRCSPDVVHSQETVNSHPDRWRHRQ